MLMQRGPLERRVDNVIADELVSKRKRGDDQEDEPDQEDQEISEPPVSRQRRASILPDTAAYNEAILASFDAVELVEEIDDKSSVSSESPPYTVNEPPDDSVDESATSSENVSVD